MFRFWIDPGFFPDPDSIFLWGVCMVFDQKRIVLNMIKQFFYLYVQVLGGFF